MNSKKVIKRISAWILIVGMLVGSVPQGAITAKAEEQASVKLTKVTTPTQAKRADNGEDLPGGSGRTGAMMVDGNITKDNYMNGGDALERLGENRPFAYYQVDMEEECDITSIKLYRYYDDSRTYQDTIVVISPDETFEDSNDIVVYNINQQTTDDYGTCATSYGAGTDDAYAETSSGHTFEVEGGSVKGRYVRVYVRGSVLSNNNRHWDDHIVELEVYGTRAGGTQETVPYDGPALVKRENYLDIPAYYSKEEQNESRLPNQVTHPDVVVFDGSDQTAGKTEWNGYKYWMIFTPNVTGTSRHENPSIIASDDGITWELPEGLTNPIEKEPPSTRYHNCDADMIYNKEMDALMGYWNWADDQGGGVGAEVRVRISYDGIHWGVPATYDKETGIWKKPVNESERVVKSGEKDFITSISSKDRYDMLSPTFTYDSYRDVYVMWANNATDVGYQNGQKNKVRMWYSENGLNWGEPMQVNNFLGTNEAGKQLAPWHQDINYIPELKEYWCLSQCFAGGNPDGSVLHLTKSKDGVNWQQAGNKPVLSPGTGENDWDNFQIYRSTFYYEPAKSGNMGEGTLRVWYSALQENTSNKLVPDTEGNLTLQATGDDGKIWRIGYAENQYYNVMKALTNNANYKEPELVTDGTLTLTTTPTDAAQVDVNSSIQLNAVFNPADISDQIVKYTSSDADIAAVDTLGHVTGIGEGMATITAATSSGLTAEKEIEVVHIPVTGLDIDADTELTMYAGSKKQVTATISPENASLKSAAFSSNAPSVVSVSEDGMLTAAAAGTAIVTVTAETYSKTITVMVDENESEVIPQSAMKASANSEHNANSATAAEGPAKNVLDGDKNTIWHSRYSPTKDNPPFTLTVLFDGEYQVNKYVYSPRKDSGGSNGNVISYELYAVKAYGSRELVDSGIWASNTQDKTVIFAPVNAVGMELKVLAGQGGFGSASEINVYKLKDSEVKPVPVTSITLNKTELALSVGDSETLSVTVEPDLANKGVVWSSGNPAVASVNNKGIVTAKAVGTTVITATSVVTPEKSAACNITVAASNRTELTGNGAVAAFDNNSGKMTLYKVAEDGTREQMSKSSSIGYPVVNGTPLTDFADVQTKLEEGIVGALGRGNRMTITSVSASTGLTRTYRIESADELNGVFYTRTSYKTGNKEYTANGTSWFVDNQFILEKPADQNTIWSYNGGGEGAQSWYDTLQKIDVTDSITFTRDNKQDYTSSGIPAADIYSSEGGITVGDASTTRRELWTPVNEKDNSAQVSIRWPNKGIAANTTVEAGESIITVHDSDYYMGLQGYGKAMTAMGMDLWSEDFQADSSYELRWESWGWEFDWTIHLILGKLNELQKLGIKQVTLDDGWYNNAGEWGLNKNKLPNGDADMKRLVDAIHDHGMTAILWWRPCDGGRENSVLYKEHPEYFVKNEDGSFGKLAGPGSYNSFLGSAGYALCPGSEGAVQSQVDFVKKAIGTWGFDGFKGDYVWSMPKCYNEAHHHTYPEESTEQQSLIYKTVFEEMKKLKPNVFNMLCNCGTPEDFYSLPYMTQVATADPTSVDQTRRRVKAYKALLGDYFPINTDHNEIWYPSAVGTGAVLIEKRNFTNETQRAEYEKWLRISQKVDLQKGRCVGDLYSYGYDPYETYVVEKDGEMYYAFFRDGNKFRPSGNPTIELKGLDPEKTYRIVDYVNDDKIVATNLRGDNAAFHYAFSNYLLVKAVEITDKDPDVDPDPSEGTTVEENDAKVIYTGNWTSENNGSASGGTCKYTKERDASAAFTFTGTRVAWYGQKDSNFGSAEVYIDNELKKTVNCNGSAEMKVKLFEITGLTSDSHTIKIANKTESIDVDYFVYYTKDIEEPIELNKTDLQVLISIADTYNMDDYLAGAYKDQFNVSIERARNAYEHAATQSALDAEVEYLINAMLNLRKKVNKDKLPDGTVSLEQVKAEKTSKKVFNPVVEYADTLKADKLIPEIKNIFDSKLDAAKGISGTATQNQINKAWAELLNIVQYMDWKADSDKEYNVTFHANGGLVNVSSIKVKENTAYPALPVPTRSGYTFLGWFTAAQGGTLIKEGDICKLAGDILVYAQWKQKQTPPVPIPVAVPLQVMGVKTSQNKTTSVKISWKAAANAKSYTLERAAGSSKKWVVVKTGITGTSYTNKGLKASAAYRFRVKAVNQAGSVVKTGKYSSELKTATAPKKPNLLSAKRKGKEVILSWKRNTAVTGYKIYVKNPGKKRYVQLKKGAKAKAKSYTVKSLKPGKKYSFKICAYKKSGGTTAMSAYSNVRTIRMG